MRVKNSISKGITSLLVSRFTNSVAKFKTNPKMMPAAVTSGCLKLKSWSFSIV